MYVLTTYELSVKGGGFLTAMLYLMLSIVSSGMGATICTAGRFLLVARLTKLDEEEEEAEEAEVDSVAPAERQRRP